MRSGVCDVMGVAMKCDQSSATTPATNGAAIDVPESFAYPPSR